jgi:hypothetical protein
MCEPSKLADDWVVKGCHIHVYGVELVVYTNHLGEIRARPFFSSARQDLAKKAIKAVYEECLPDASMRRRWIQRLEMARVFMLDYYGELHGLANGRMLEFKFLRIAIERWGENANA